MFIFLKIYECSGLKFSDKYLKSLSDKFSTSFSKLEFINCLLSIKSKFLFIVEVMNFSNPLCITLTFTSNSLITFMIK